MKNRKDNKFLLIPIVLLLVFGGTALAEDLTPIQMLGKSIFFDKISSPDWMSCATCHAPNTGWTGPIPGINKHGAVYRGAIPTRFGNRKPPSAAYATQSPNFYWDGELFVGGNFWDGRATGWNLGNPAADQALGPFLNPVEQNNPAKMAVLGQIASSKYADIWEEVWGEPISWETIEDIENNYDRVGLSIAAYEDSSEVNQFSSKYDAYLAGEVELNEQEAFGLELFEGKAKCSLCHLSDPEEQDPPLFTDYTFDNLGVPKNPENPFYEMDQVLLDDGSPINPLGSSWVDYGLGGFLRSLAAYGSWRNLTFVTNVKDMTAGELSGHANDNDGKHKVPTLRNVAKGFNDKGSPKAYMHNGVFKTLKEVVHFYNTRDVEDWPAPEVADNVNTEELGNLGLTEEEEDAIVAFLVTLSDGYKVKKK